MKNQIIIRRYESRDKEKVLDIIIKNFYQVNIKDYTINEMNEIADIYRNGKLDELEKHTHFYVALYEREIVGCGAIGPFTDEGDTAILLTVFIRPDCQGKGIGEKIIRSLEADDKYKKLKRIKLYASLTAYPFYLKMGYNYIDGKKVITDEKNIIMIKHL